MTIYSINPNVRDPRARANFQRIQLSLKDIDADMMRETVYDADADTYIDVAAGGTGDDFSAVTAGSVLVFNSTGVISAITSARQNDMPMIQSDGSVAWDAKGSLANLLLTTDGHAVVTEAEGQICSIAR